MAAGDLDRAQVLAEQAEAAAWSITDPGRQAEALAGVAIAAAGAGDLDRALELAPVDQRPGRQAEALAGVAVAAAGAGDLDRARGRLARSISDPGRQAEALAGVAVAAARAGDLDRAQALAEQAEAAAQSIIDLGEQELGA